MFSPGFVAQDMEDDRVKKPSKPTIITKPPKEEIPTVSLERLGSAEEQAQREKLARDLMIQQQAAQRQLAAAQARAGIRGGAAAAQQARLAQNVETGRSQQEAEQALQRRLFNLEQSQKEQFANVASQLALKQIASSAEGQKLLSDVAKQSLQSQLDIARSGGKIICTELHRQGLLDEKTYEVDQKFGQLMRIEQPEVMMGYWLVARPIVNLMQRSKLFTHLIGFFAKPWANHMVYLMGATSKDSRFGKLIMTIGKPICLFAAKRSKPYAHS